MEFLTGDVRRVSVRNAEIYGGPVEGLRFQGVLTGDPEDDAEGFAVVVWEYSPKTRRTPFYCADMDQVAELMSGIVSDFKTQRKIDSLRARGVEVLPEVPDGWTRERGATAPAGFAWYSNNKSHFGGERRSALVRIAGR